MAEQSEQSAEVAALLAAFEGFVESLPAEQVGLLGAAFDRLAAGSPEVEGHLFGSGATFGGQSLQDQQQSGQGFVSTGGGSRRPAAAVPAAPDLAPIHTAVTTSKAQLVDRVVGHMHAALIG